MAHAHMCAGRAAQHGYQELINSAANRDVGDQANTSSVATVAGVPGGVGWSASASSAIDSRDALGRALAQLTRGA